MTTNNMTTLRTVKELALEIVIFTSTKNQDVDVVEKILTQYNQAATDVLCALGETIRNDESGGYYSQAISDYQKLIRATLSNKDV